MLEDIEKKLKPTPVMKARTTIQLPMKVKDKVESVPMNVVLPHMMFATLHEHHPDIFEKRMLGGKRKMLLSIGRQWVSTLPFRNIQTCSGPHTAIGAFQYRFMEMEYPRPAAESRGERAATYYHGVRCWI